MYQYPNNQQQMQLPANPSQLTIPFVNGINGQNPPVVPNIPTAPEVTQWMPTISAMAALEIQSKAQTNPLRVFMFNRYAANGFNNPEFVSLLATIADYIVYGRMKNQFNSIEQAVQHSVPAVVEMLCAMALNEFPALEHYVPADIAYTARGYIGHFTQIVAEIQSMQARGQFPGVGPSPTLPPVGYPQQQAYPQQQSYPQPGYMPAVGAAGTPGRSYGAPPNLPPLGGGRAPQPSVGNTGLFTPAPTPSYPSNTAAAVGTRTYGRRYDDANTSQAPADMLQPPFQSSLGSNNLNNQNNGQVLPQAETLIPVDIDTWRPDPDSQIWYLPAFNPTTHDLFMRIGPDGKQSPVLKKKDKEMMEYDRHKLNTVFGAVPRSLDLSNQAKVIAGLSEGIRELNGEKAEVGDGGQYIARTAVKQEWLVEPSLEVAWALANVARMRGVESNGNPDIFRVYSKIAQPMVALEDETALVESLANCSTFIELRDKMNGSVNGMSPALWGKAHRKMTDTINRILRRHLSLPKLEITDFTEDIEDIIGLLDDQYGETIRDAFLKYQKRHIRTTFGTITKELADDMSTNLIDPKDFEGVQMPKITYMSSDISLTYINCRSHELELELVDGLACALTPDFTPIMHALVKNLFEEVAKLEGEQFDRHLIRTNDGRVLEATRGYIGDDFYLLTLVE